jgi:hypothetical protein
MAAMALAVTIIASPTLSKRRACLASNNACLIPKGFKMPQEAVYKGEFKFHGWSTLENTWELRLGKSAPERAELTHWKAKNQEVFILKVEGKEVAKWVEGDEAVAEITPGATQVAMTPRTDQLPLAGYGIYFPKSTSRFVVKDRLERNSSNFDPCREFKVDCQTQFLQFSQGETGLFAKLGNKEDLFMKMNGIERQRFELGPMKSGWPSTISSKAWDYKGNLSYEGTWRLETVGQSKTKSMNWEDGLKPGMTQVLFKNNSNVYWNYQPGQKGIWKVWETQNSMRRQELAETANQQSSILGNIGLWVAIASLAGAFVWQMGRKVSKRAAKP